MDEVVKQEKRSVWDSCSTSPVSLSGKMLVALSSIARDNNMSKSKVVQLLLLESQTIGETLSKLEDSGIFDETNSRYDQFKKKQEALRK